MSDAASTRWPPGGVYALSTLILAAAVANLNLAVANVALPDIGAALDATQAGLNMVAVGFTLGLAASVLYLGALGDRHGRRLMLLIGLTASIPLAALAAWAPNIEVLILARLLGGVAAGMVYPTTLSIIVAMFSGRQRTMAIALWSGLGAGASSLGPPIVGWLLTFAWWGAGFVITIPLAAVALIMSLRLPRRAGESKESVDNLSGVVSVIMIGTLVLGITFAPMPGKGALAIGLGIVAVISIAFFVFRQRRLANPLYDLQVAKQRIFWVAAVAGIIVFGSLMGSFFIGQQFLQDVMGYNTFEAGLAILPSAVGMVLLSPVAARLINSVGSRLTLIIGFALLGLGFVLMFVWRADSPYWIVGLAYFILGSGVAIAAAPASRSIMAVVPTKRLGMGSATNDLQRDLGGAIMQAVMGTLLVVRYAESMKASFAAAPASEQQELTDQAVTTMTSSFAGAEKVASTLPQADAEALIGWAQSAFTQGSNVAFAFALGAVLVGMVLVGVAFPRKADEIAIESRAPDA
jgi:EmrB/QacA subfamily drug resistance transporter